MTNHVSVEEILEKVITTISNQSSIESKKADKNPETCSHYFGYLANCLKSSSIPEECLTCLKVVDCAKS